MQKRIKNLMYLYGKNSVLERLKAKPKSIKKIFLQENFDNPDTLNLIKSRNIPIERVTEKKLTRIKRADRLQGIVAEVDRFRYIDFEELLGNPQRKSVSLVFLDNLNDPHNLGAIIRTLACFGGFGVVIPRYSSCEVNDTVMHVAQGGENYVSVSMVNNINNVLIKAKRAGYWIVGTVIENGEEVSKVSFPFPLCLVLGSEGKGIRYGIEKQLDLKLTLPMGGAGLSFNVAVACAVFCYEIARQRP